MFTRFTPAWRAFLRAHANVRILHSRAIIVAALLLWLSSVFCSCAYDDYATTQANSSVTICVGENDIVFSRLGSRRFFLSSDPSHGSVIEIPGDGCYEYTPEEGFVGSDSFGYQECADMPCTRATVFITVTELLTTATATSTATATNTPTDTPTPTATLTPTATATATDTPLPAGGIVPEPEDTCGDEVCDPNAGESPVTCPADCGLCGNGVCDPGEHVYNCSVDCGEPPPPDIPPPPPGGTLTP